MPDIISNPELITPAWLTSALQSVGYLANGRVASASYKVIGTGKMGDNARFSLQYEGEQGDAPNSVVAKLPAADIQARGNSAATGAYDREVQFYDIAAPHTTMRTPEIYFNAVNEAGDDFITLMEDLSPAEPGNQLVGCTVEQAKLAVVEAARLHASFYGSPKLANYAWVTNGAEPDSAAFGHALMVENWPLFAQRFAHYLTPERIAMGAQYSKNYDKWVSGYTLPATMIHGDYRAENMMFGGDTSAAPIAIVDWQTASANNPLNDVAYFLGGSVQLELRREIERDMVELYRAELNRLGVELDADTAWREYRRGTCHGLIITVLGAMFTEAGERSDKMFGAMIAGHLQHAVDLDAHEFWT